MPRTRLSWSSSAVTSTMGIIAVAGSRLSLSQMEKPSLSGSMMSSRMRSGGAAAMLASAALPSGALCALIPSVLSRRERKAHMSGSSSTTRTRNSARGTVRPPAARSLIADLDLGEEVAVGADRGVDRGAVAAARAVLDGLAEVGHAVKAVGGADALHAVAELAQLLEIRRGKGDAQGIELLAAVLHEDRDQVLQVLRHRYLVAVVVHLSGIIERRRGQPDGPPSGFVNESRAIS